MAGLASLRIGRRPVTSRTLVVLQADPAAVAPLLPAGARPLVLRGRALVVSCHTRLGTPRRRWLPGQGRAATDHLAHHVPATFAAQAARGSWILERATSSWLEARCGETLRRGAWHRSSFALSEDPFGLELRVAHDGEEELYLRAEASPTLHGSLFLSVREAEEVLCAAADVRPSDLLAPEADVLDLGDDAFAAEALAVRELRSSLLAGKGPFPPGSVEPDCALRFVTKRVRPVGRRTVLRYAPAPVEGLPALPSA